MEHEPTTVQQPIEWNVKAPKQLMLLISAQLFLSLIMACGMAFFVYRSTVTANAMMNIQHYVVEKSAKQAPPGSFKVFIPKMKTGYKLLSDGSARVCFEFAPSDAAAAASLAQVREQPLYIKVTRESPK
jgi:uncharacterized membrane-anchored protein YitT (DUF2179 family)